MLNWNNLDTLASYQELEKAERINLAEVMSGENGAERVKTYSTPIVDGLTFNYAAKAVDDNVLAILDKLAKEAQLVEKYDELPQDIKWHMIGHLQRNKVKYIVDKVCLIHSVDSYRLAEEINIQAKKKNITVPILVEVNIAEESSKFGIHAEDAIALVEQIAQLENVRIKGLMTIAPLVENPEDNRQYFRNIRQLSVDIAAKNIDNVSMNVLSMGMTGDYMVAIEEGATMVRVGTGIFGERNYNK